MVPNKRANAATFTDLHAVPTTIQRIPPSVLALMRKEGQVERASDAPVSAATAAPSGVRPKAASKAPSDERTTLPDCEEVEAAIEIERAHASVRIPPPPPAPKFASTLASAKPAPNAAPPSPTSETATIPAPSAAPMQPSSLATWLAASAAPMQASSLATWLAASQVRQAGALLAVVVVVASLIGFGGYRIAKHASHTAAPRTPVTQVASHR